MFHVKQRIREKLIEPVQVIGHLAVTALVVAVIALLAVAMLLAGRNVSRGTYRKAS